MIIIDEEKYRVEKITKNNQINPDYLILNQQNEALYYGKNIDSIYQILDHEMITLGNSEDKEKTHFEQYNVEERKMIFQGDFETCESIFSQKIWLLAEDKNHPSMIYNSHNKRKVYFSEQVAGISIKDMRQMGRRFAISVILNIKKKGSVEKIYVYLNMYTLKAIGVYLPSCEKYIEVSIDKPLSEILEEVKDETFVLKKEILKR